MSFRRNDEGISHRYAIMNKKKCFWLFFLKQQIDKISLDVQFLRSAGSQSHNDETEQYREQFPRVGDMVSRKLGKACSVEGLKRRLPITEWLPNYQKSYFMQDFVAGLSVGLTAIPQGIAYAVVAGLPPQYGLYSGFMGNHSYFIILVHTCT